MIFQLLFVVPLSASPSNRGISTPKLWYEKVVDAIIGDEEGPHQKYALICQQCFEHNGLVPPHEYETKCIVETIIICKYHT